MSETPLPNRRSETPLPNRRKMKLNRIMVTTVDGNYRLHQKAYISQNPFTDQWSVRIVEPDNHNRRTLYPYNQIREVVMEDEDENDQTR